MKKIISCLIVALTLSLLLSSCSKSDAAKAFIEEVEAIGEVTPEKSELIEKAEKTYAFLSADDKGDVKKAFEKLNTMKEQLAKINDFDERAKELSAVFGKVLTEYGISRDSFMTEYEALKSEIDGADDFYKVFFQKSFDEVEAKYSQFAETEKNAAASAVSYIKGFNEYMKNEGRSATVKNIGCIAQIADETEYFLFAVTVEENGEEKNIYSRARFAGTPAVKSFTQYAENFYNEAPASEKTDALINGNVLIDTQAVLSSVQ